MIDFECKGKKYKIADPTDKDLEEGEARRLKALTAAINNGCFLESQVYEQAEKLDIWNEDKAKELSSAQKEISALEQKLEAGGYDLNEAVEDAKKMSQLRNQIFSITMAVNNLLEYSADRYADLAEADFLLWKTLKDDKGKQVFKTLAEFVTAKKQDDEIIRSALLARVNSDISFLLELPENKFLIKYGRMNENLEFLDENGELEFKIPEKKKIKAKPFTKDGEPIKEPK